MNMDNNTTTRTGRLKGRLAARSLTVAAGAFTLVGLAAGASFASTPTSAADLATTEAPAMSEALLGVAGAVAVPAVTILAVKKGWPWIKRFF
jgi:hypothetical protein